MIKLGEMVMQRVCAIALGYEDVNDHDSLRRDPVLGALAGCLDVNRRRNGTPDWSGPLGPDTIRRRL